MISADDANVKRTDTPVTITAGDLVIISDHAKIAFKNKHAPRELDNSEFVSLCFLYAVECLLAQKGINFTATYTPKRPYESDNE